MGHSTSILYQTNFEHQQDTDYQNMYFLLLSIVLSSTAVLGNVFTVDLATLTTQRLDAILFPDQSPEGHVHSIVGGSKFSKTSTYEELLSSQCSTGNIAKDLSAYWVPTLYVKKANGKFHHVDMNFAVYYKLINDRGQTDFNNNPIIPGEFKAFPPRFKMIAGNIQNTEAHHQINLKLPTLALMEFGRLDRVHYPIQSVFQRCSMK